MYHFLSKLWTLQQNKLKYIYLYIYTQSWFPDYLGITVFLRDVCYLAFLDHWRLQQSGFFFFFLQKQLQPKQFFVSHTFILAWSLILVLIAFMISFLHPILKISMHSIFILRWSYLSIRLLTDTAENVHR